MRPLKWTEDLIARMQKDGCGQGTDVNYRPWLNVQSLSSRGVSRRVWGHKSQREHHLLSNIEFNLFLCLEWSRDVIDIREQYPLDRELTQAVAESLRIRHPHYPGTHVLTVMTVDFLVTRICHGEEILEAFNAKGEDEAEDENSLQKLEIQREACDLLGFKHHIVFDTSIPKQTAVNIGWVRDAFPKPNEPEPRPGYFEELAHRMEEDLGAHSPDLTLQAYCASFDSRFGAPQGAGLRVARMLIQQRILKADMECADLAGQHMGAFVMTGSQSKLRVIAGR
jgi:hypothetical protein